MNAVVIGSGVGGLVAANLLAMRGWTVTVLEQHYRAGGYLHRFFRNGAGFDTGFHYVGAARPDQLFGKVLRHVGVYDQLDLRELDPDGFDELRLPGLTVRVPAGAERWRDRLTGLFPHQAGPLRLFFERMEAAVTAYGLYKLDPGAEPTEVLPFEAISVSGVLDQVGIDDPRLRTLLASQAILYGVPPDDAPFGMHAIVSDHFSQGAWTIAGGGDRLALVLVKALRARGGRVVFRARAERIDVVDGVATAVQTADGERFAADLVLANAHPAAVAEMVPPGAFRKVYTDRVASTRPGLAHFGVYLRVEGDLSAIAGHNVYRLRSWGFDTLSTPMSAEDVPFYFLSAPGSRETGGGKKDVVLALGLADWAAWAGHEGAHPRPEAYRTEKAALGAALVRAIQEDFPDWRITLVEASTPITTREFMLARGGAIYGHYHSVQQMGRYRLPMRTRVRNLIHVGQCVGFPGICGATMTAYLAVGAVVGLEGLVEELRLT